MIVHCHNCQAPINASSYKYAGKRNNDIPYFCGQPECRKAYAVAKGRAWRGRNPKRKPRQEATCQCCGDVFWQTERERSRNNLPPFCTKPECRAQRKLVYNRMRMAGTLEVYTRGQAHLELAHGDPYKNFAVNIIIQALSDYRGTDEETRADVDKFFSSAWFEYLAEAVGFHPDFIRKYLDAGAQIPDALKYVPVQEGW